MDSAMTFGLSDSHYPLRHMDGINDTVIEEDIGKLFNHHTKLTFQGCDTGVNLRAQLWWFLRSEILTLKVDFKSLAGKFHCVNDRNYIEKSALTITLAQIDKRRPILGQR